MRALLVMLVFELENKMLYQLRFFTLFSSGSNRRGKWIHDLKTRGSPYSRNTKDLKNFAMIRLTF